MSFKKEFSDNELKKHWKGSVEVVQKENDEWEIIATVENKEVSRVSVPGSQAIGQTDTAEKAVVTALGDLKKQYLETVEGLLLRREYVNNALRGYVSDKPDITPETGLPKEEATM